MHEPFRALDLLQNWSDPRQDASHGYLSEWMEMKMLSNIDKNTNFKPRVLQRKKIDENLLHSPIVYKFKKIM